MGGDASRKSVFLFRVETLWEFELLDLDWVLYHLMRGGVARAGSRSSTFGHKVPIS